jgi:hypothetical protein
MKYLGHEPRYLAGNRRSRPPVRRTVGTVSTAMPIRGGSIGGPLDRAHVIAIQRLAGNAAATALVQRSPAATAFVPRNPATTALVQRNAAATTLVQCAAHRRR